MAGDRRDSAVRRVLPIVIVAVAVWRVVFVLRPDGASGVGDVVSAVAGDVGLKAPGHGDVAAMVLSPGATQTIADAVDGRPRPPRGFSVSLSCPPIWSGCASQEQSCTDTSTQSAPLRLDRPATRRAALATADGGVRTTGLKAPAEPDSIGVIDAEDDLLPSNPVLGPSGAEEGISDVRPAPGP